MRPKLDVLLPQGRRLWSELSQVPEHFVLYGGTAIALRLGGRQSVDFDFFTNQSISAEPLTRSLPFLRGAELIQSEPNTATFSVHREGEIKVSFFGGLTIGRVMDPERCEDNGVLVASLLDLAAQKMKVILVRAESKDYLDVYNLLKAGITLPKALGAARALYPEFNPAISLKALAYYGEPGLASLSVEVREFLTAASAKVESVAKVAKIAPGISASNAQTQNRRIHI
ncbi:MAG TPA: nucleotidyl transferase AbiEii/AbiGii toxin family protein [Bryobacteraceae bacterium]|nr:nucleotidyl transferase AbiEii/AbiGii toxin family protein [Bryobacteraceae bacterium]